MRHRFRCGLPVEDDVEVRRTGRRNSDFGKGIGAQGDQTAMLIKPSILPDPAGVEGLGSQCSEGCASGQGWKTELD